MPGEGKLIGICLSQAYSQINAGIIHEINRAASRNGFVTAVMHTELDFFWYKQGNSIARSIFNTINYDLFSALVVVRESFHDDHLMDKIIREATEHQVPVFCLGEVWDGCVSILYDYFEPYRDFMSRVISEKNIREPFYISGIENEANSALRIQCFREALKKCGLPFRKDNVEYGLFYDEPVRRIVEDLIKTRDRLPDAFFCANDYMAMAVCDVLKEHGIRVPEDVKVAGFDGVPASCLVSPQLSTCSMNLKTLGEETVDLIMAHGRGEKINPVQHHAYLPVFSESCGYEGIFRELPGILEMYRFMEAQNSQENYIFQMVQRMIEKENVQDVLLLLSQAIPPRCAVCLNSSFLTTDLNAEYNTDCLESELICLEHQVRGAKLPKLNKIRLRELMVRDGGEPGISFFSSIHTDNTVCGCFVAYTEDLEKDYQMIKRTGDMLNLAFTVLVGNVRQRRLLTHLENSLYTDPLTGMPNMKGLDRWFESYCDEESNHEKILALSIYNIYRYEYLYETYGIREAEDIVQLVAKYLCESNPEAVHLARVNEKQFAVVNSAENDEELGKIIDRCVASFFGKMEYFNVRSGKSFFLEVNCGCTSLNQGWESPALSDLIHLATGEMYLNRMRFGSHVVEKKDSTDDMDLYSSFRMLIDKDLFKYHFQPIVDARSGQISAYEALMRTDEAIGMNPMQILKMAEEYNRLYDVEKRTLFGIMDRFTRDYPEFHNNRVFINTIPGNFLSDEDSEEFMKRYESFLDCFVFELTEQGVTTDRELEQLKRIHKAGGQTQIAVDDFGTGHSNIVNLLRYVPQIIKIDRELISGIQNDSNKQLFVRNTIEFAHQNGIKVLAEGVETLEEMRCVIECGTDLLQGFYLGRPAEHPAEAIPREVRDEILEENLRRRQADPSRQVYRAKDGETLRLIDLSVHKYASIQIPAGEVTITGETEHIADMMIRVDDRAKTRINLDHCSLRGAVESAVQLGNESELTLNLIGKNAIYKDGIRVPASSSLKIVGSGDLKIENNRNYSVGIGANFNDPYGTIEIEMDGVLSFESNGEKVVCLGGGRSEGMGIMINRADIRLSANAVNVVGIGSSSGPALIRIRRGAKIESDLKGNDVLAIGSISGQADIRIAGLVNVTAESERGVGIGTISGTASVLVKGGRVDAVTRSDVCACIGSFTGNADVTLREGYVRVHGEGNNVCGVGSLEGSCETRVSGGTLEGDLLAGKRMILGNEKSRCLVTGGNILLEGADTNPPTGPEEEKLRFIEPAGDVFEQEIRLESGEWNYRAERNAEGRLGVWIPEENAVVR